MLKVVAAATADEASVNHVSLCRPLHTHQTVSQSTVGVTSKPPQWAILSALPVLSEPCSNWPANLVVKFSAERNQLTTTACIREPMVGVWAWTDLEVPEFWEGVDDDAKDDVEADGGDEYEEGSVVDDKETELGERVLSRMTLQVLQTHRDKQIHTYTERRCLSQGLKRPTRH